MDLLKIENIHLKWLHYTIQPSNVIQRRSKYCTKPCSIELRSFNKKFDFFGEHKLKAVYFSWAMKLHNWLCHRRSFWSRSPFPRYIQTFQKNPAVLAASKLKCQTKFPESLQMLRVHLSIWQHKINKYINSKKHN